MSFAPLVLRWRLAPDASLVSSGATGLTLGLADGRTLPLTPGHAGLRDALLALMAGVDEPSLAAVAGEERAAQLYYYLGRLAGSGVLEASADLDGVPLVRLLPHDQTFELASPCALPLRVALDRFAFLRRGERGALLQHPDAACDLVVDHPVGAAALARLAAGPIVMTEAEPIERALAALLVALGFAADPALGEGPARRTWEFHDRLFQRAARSYDDRTVRGSSYRFIGTLPSPPAIRPFYPGPSIALPLPNLRSSGGGRDLRAIMEARRSRRAMSSTPVDLETVGELLHRVARVTEVMPGTTDVPQDTLLRPFPSGGAIHELEFYLAVHACGGLAAGFYHYRGREHVLTRLVGAEGPAAAMLEDCARAWGQSGHPPQVLVVIASRLPRLAWKYSGIAYRISLMNAGVALQSLYLVATDLGLAGSAAGSGSPAHFARATGMSSWEETSIAEFGFGRPA